MRIYLLHCSCYMNVEFHRLFLRNKRIFLIKTVDRMRSTGIYYDVFYILLSIDNAAKYKSALTSAHCK